MDDFNTGYNYNKSDVTIQNKIDVVMAGKKSREFVVECAEKLFTNMNFDYYISQTPGVTVDIIAKDCVKKAIALAQVLKKEGFLDD